MLEAYNLNGLAQEAFVEAIPENPYDLCPCGCDQKWRFVSKDENILKIHEQKFVEEFIRKYKETHLKN